MGIYCEINLHKSNGVFVGARGNVVSGIIKYAVDEETTFNNIIVSLKGLGATCLEQYYIRPTTGRRVSHYSSEKYIDIDNVIENKEKGAITLPGTYEIPFSFEIPLNVPPSVKYKKNGRQCTSHCSIKYYVRIKFSRRGVFNLTKRFKKPITMVSAIVPRLPTTPVMYGEEKKLTTFFSNSGNVNIKATIMNSVLKGGDKIEFHYEVTNNTNLTINGVETKLVEIHKFYIGYTTQEKKPNLKEYDDIAGTDSRTGSIKSGESQEMSCEINIPSDRETSEFFKIYAREYNVFITAYLPVPHKNVVLKIPFQIGNIVGDNVAKPPVYENQDPPSYWEAMNEYKKDKIEFNDSENNDNVSKEKTK